MYRERYDDACNPAPAAKEYNHYLSDRYRTTITEYKSHNESIPQYETPIQSKYLHDLRLAISRAPKIPADVSTQVAPIQHYQRDQWLEESRPIQHQLTDPAAITMT
jgi:hypothetical protein